MRPDDINPRTGLVVALVSVVLVFGFMFTVSGIKGETLGDIPLLAIGPAICLPGIAAIALARKTDGCTKWPDNTRRPPCGSCCCCRKKPRDKDVLELLRTPSDLESGKGSCDELAKKAYGAKDRKGSSRGGGEDGLSTCTTITTSAAVGEGRGSLHKVEQEEKLRYLENCCPEMPGNVLGAGATLFSALDEQENQQQGEGSPVFDGAPALPGAEDTVSVAPLNSIIVCSYKDSSPYDRYCCYINPSEEISSDHETIV
ncbi:transmembrane protein 215 [Zootoca vivipara]|uniref:transmembrane protein 215 n=1 Tax=Zootoca vivipara TaxID=8524 RepID=UPI0015911762|nr:transmembrane protein 215 [Zootoca vivipara]